VDHGTIAVVFEEITNIDDIVVCAWPFFVSLPEGMTVGELPVSGSIEGIVTLDTGSPASKVSCRLYHQKTMQFIEQTTTDALGQYQFTGLPSGTYAVTYHNRSDSTIYPNMRTGIVVTAE